MRIANNGRALLWYVQAVWLALIFSLAMFSPAYSLPIDENQNFTLIPSSISQKIARFSGFGSRVTGYPGYYNATQYIKSFFKNLSLDVIEQKYRVLVPIDRGSYIEVSDSSSVEKLPVYPLWPNLVQVSSGIVEGRLVYARGESLEDFDGKDLDGAIVVMDLASSGDRWVDALSFGASAVVFVGGECNRYQAMQKLLLTPLYAPRAYAPGDAGSRLVKLATRGLRAKLVINVSWEEVEAENVVGVIKGAKTPDEAVVVTAHYDSFSIVPALSPGSDEASSVAVLLTLAEFYARGKPDRTLIFAALSGHWEGLAGAREFIEAFFFNQKLPYKVLALVNLDLSSDGDQVSALHIGHFYKYGSAGGGPEIVSRYNWIKNIIGKVRQEVLPELGLSPYALNDVLTQYYWDSTILEPIILDSEPAALAGLPAFSLVTSFARRLYWWTPFDTLDRVDVGKLQTQTLVVHAVLSQILSSSGVPLYDVARVRLYGRGGPASFITLRGKVVFFNLTKGWYDPLPGAIVRVGVNPQASFLPFANIFVKSDSRGEFEVHGLPVATVLSYRTAVFVEAWYLDETSRIKYAPDLGTYGARTFPPYLSLWTHPENATAVVFECASIELFDMLNPAYMRRGVIGDPTSSGDLAYLTEQARLMPYSLNEYSEPLFYGTLYNPKERVALVFVQPRFKAVIALQRGVVKIGNVGVLVNSSPSNPEGEGFQLESPGDRLRVTFTALRFAKDMYSVSSYRYSILSSRFVSSPTAPEVLSKAEMFIEKAEAYLRNKTYSKAYGNALLAWSWALTAYDVHVMPLIFDLSGTAVVFYALLLPFAFFFERLALRQSGLRRLLATVAVAGVLLTVFSFVHPSLALISNSALALAGILVLTFLLFVTAILSSETSRIVEEESVKRLGMHTFQKLRVSLAEVFSSVALESMRRYRLRTLLTLLTMLSITIAVVSLTSSSYMLGVTTSKLPYSAYYEGFLLKKGRSEPPYNVLDVYTAYAVDALLEGAGRACLRVRLWPSTVYPLGRVAYLKPEVGSNATVTVRGILGLEPFESRILLKSALIRGRLFEEYDYYACLLTDSQAKALGVDVGDVIDLHGLKLLVVGVLSSQALGQIRDLDDLAVTPLDPRTIPQYAVSQAQARIAYPLPYDDVLIVPSGLALDLGGSVWSIAVYLKSEIPRAEAEAAAAFLAKTLEVPVYVGSSAGVIGYSRIVTWSLMGWESVVVLLVIGSLNIVITFMASVRERTKDIMVYSAVGLPPRGTFAMFLTESLVYSSIVIPIGYIAGVVLNYLLYLAGILPTTYVLNFSSLSLALSLLALIAVIVLSSIYPALAASGIITPSLERRWRIPTSPRGDLWEIPLPVTATSKQEALAMLLYLKEYLEGSGRVTVYYTVLEEPLLRDGSIVFKAALAPKELNITQEATVLAYEASLNRYGFLVRITRLTGRYETWRTSNYYFVDSLRKQLLLWRSLREEDRRKYLEKVK
jgi:hypothetical protein